MKVKLKKNSKNMTLEKIQNLEQIKTKRRKYIYINL